MRLTPGACTIKHYEFVIYRKLTNFIVSQCLLAWTDNTLAYYGVCILPIRNVFIVQATGFSVIELFCH